MPYEAQISRTSPTAILFVIDQSGSMSDTMASGKTKAEFVADALNRSLMNLIARCTKAEGVRDYFEIGVLGYGANNAVNGFSGELGKTILNPISELEKNPSRIEDRKRKIDDGAGGIIETTIKFPVWFEPVAGGGTPMCQALTKAAEELAIWCDSHPESYPPTLLHVTDGEATDGHPEQIAEHLRQIKTHDGEVLFLNIHVSTRGEDPICYPNSDRGLPDAYAEVLFRMSSVLPEHLLRFAQDKGHDVHREARGFMFNAEASELVDFFEIGTRASQLR